MSGSSPSPHHLSFPLWLFVNASGLQLASRLAWLACRDEAAALPEEAEAQAMLQAVGWEAGRAHLVRQGCGICTDSLARILTLAKGTASCNLNQTGQPCTSAEILPDCHAPGTVSKVCSVKRKRRRGSAGKRILKGGSECSDQSKQLNRCLVHVHLGCGVASRNRSGRPAKPSKTYWMKGCSRATRT